MLAVQTMSSSGNPSNTGQLTIFDARSLAAAQGNMLMVSWASYCTLTVTCTVLPVLLGLQSLIICFSSHVCYLFRVKELKTYLATLDASSSILIFPTFMLFERVMRICVLLCYPLLTQSGSHILRTHNGSSLSAWYSRWVYLTFSLGCAVALWP